MPIPQSPNPPPNQGKEQRDGAPETKQRIPTPPKPSR